jgi:hypothetical protein
MVWATQADQPVDQGSVVWQIVRLNLMTMNVITIDGHNMMRSPSLVLKRWDDLGL